MKAYAILLSQENDLYYVMNKDVANVIKRHHGGSVARGYDQQKYVACLVFAKMLDRNRCAVELQKRGLVFDTNDNGIIEDKYGIRLMSEAENEDSN